MYSRKQVRSWEKRLRIGRSKKKKRTGERATEVEQQTSERMKGASGGISIKQQRLVEGEGGTGGVRLEEEAWPGSCDMRFSNSNRPKPRQDCKRALAAAICVGNTVRAFSNRRTQAQTPTQSVVPIAVARLVLSIPETARFAQRSSAQKPRQPLQVGTARSPKHHRGATACTLRARRASQESRLSGVCAALVHVKIPGLHVLSV